jgi:WD40 repeat protein
MDNTRPNPYVGPRTFNKDERDRFYGRDREARELLSLVASEQFVIFYAQSGAGKSSLVNTSLIPDLEKKGFYVLPVARVLGDAPAGLQVENIFAFNLMRSLATTDMPVESFANLKLTEFSRQLKQRASTGFEGYVLIVDQFEEIFSTHNDQWESREDFFRQLTRAMRDNPDLWVLLVMREDFIAGLDPYTHLLHERGRIRYYMQRLERDAALKAIQGPVENVRPYEENVAEKLFNDLCSIKVLGPDGKTLIDQPGQYVEPVQMQVVCYNLWENLGDGNAITAADLAKVGDVDAALGNYYAARVKGVAETKQVSERHIREWIEKKLIASGGIRNQVLQERVTPPGGLDDDVIQALQSDLVRSEKRGASTFYELTHDRLVEPILENNKLWFSEKLSPLQRQAALWVDKGRKDDWLSTGQALADIEAWAQQHPDDLSNVDREFLEESRAYQHQLDERQTSQARELEMSRKFAEEQALANQRIRKALRTSTFIAAVATLFLGIAILLGIESFQNQRETQMRILMNASAEALAKKDNNLATLLAYQALINYGDEFGEAESALGGIVEPIKNDPIQVPYFVGDAPIGEITALGVSSDGKWLAAGESNGIVTLWDLEMEKNLGEFTIYNAVTYLAFSPDNKTLAVVGTSSNINLWNVSSPREPREITALAQHTDTVYTVAFSPDGKLLASASNDKTIILWAMTDPTGPSVVSTLSGHTEVVWGVAFSPDGKTLASGSWDDTIILWDVSNPVSASIIAILKGHTADVEGVAFSPDGKILASVSDDYSIILWDVAAKKPIGQPLRYHNEIVRDVAFSSDGSTLASHSDDDMIFVWDIKDLTQPLHLASLNGNDMKFAPDGKILLVGGTDGVTMWDVNLATPKQVRTFDKSNYGDVERVNHLSLLPDGASLFILNSGKTPQLINIDAQKKRPFDMSFSTSFDNSPKVVFSVNGQYAASVNDAYVLTVRDLSAQRDIGQWSFYENLGAVSPDGKYVVSFINEDVRIRDTNTGAEISRIGSGTNTFKSIFSSDGKYLALASNDKDILVWTVEAGRVTYRIPIMDRYVKHMAFSLDGTRLAVAFDDSNKSVEVWDLATEQKLLLIEDSELKPLNYAVAGGFNFKAQEVPQSGTAPEDPVLDGISEDPSNIIGLAYTEDGLIVLHQNGLLDRWAIWPGRGDLEKYARAQCISCELSYAQRRDYGLYTWHMWVRDYAGYFIFLLNLVGYIVCALFGYRALFSKTARQTMKQLSAWKAFWRASGQGSLLLVFSLLVWVVFSYIEVFKYPDGRQADVFELLWLTLPFGLWAGGAYGHFTRGQSGKWSTMKRAALGAFAGGLSGLFSVVIGLIALLYVEARHQPDAVAELMRQNDFWYSLLTPYASGVGIAIFTSLLGACFYMFWLAPWSEGKTSPVADWFRYKLPDWMQPWWKRGILVFSVSTILGIISVSIATGSLIDPNSDLIPILLISGTVGVFGFLFHPQRSSYIWTVALGVVFIFMWYLVIDTIPVALWFGLSTGFMLSAAFSRSWKRVLFIFILGTILCAGIWCSGTGSLKVDDFSGIIIISILFTGLGRVFYPHRFSYIMVAVLSVICITVFWSNVGFVEMLASSNDWYFSDIRYLILGVGLSLGFILSAILSRILHALKKI